MAHNTQNSHAGWERGEVAELRNRILQGLPLTSRDEELIQNIPYVAQVAERAYSLRREVLAKRQRKQLPEE